MPARKGEAPREVAAQLLGGPLLTAVLLPLRHQHQAHTHPDAASRNIAVRHAPAHHDGPPALADGRQRHFRPHAGDRGSCIHGHVCVSYMSIYTCVCVCVCVCVCTYTHIHGHPHIYVYMHVYICIHIFIYIYAYVYRYISTYIYTHTHTHTHIHIHTHIRTHIHVSAATFPPALFIF